MNVLYYLYIFIIIFSIFIIVVHPKHYISLLLLLLLFFSSNFTCNCIDQAQVINLSPSSSLQHLYAFPFRLLSPLKAFNLPGGQ